ncbi:MAG: phytoene desaturase family protein [Prevotella sp.]|jgi:all-trans-retinol 13,14-reductase
MKETDVLIIGAGLGGLFTGALLAKEGLRVTLVEKNATIGGGLQTFRRWGETFDTGMHVVAGMGPGGNIRAICQYLGILPEVRLRDVDDDCTDSLYFAEDHQTYRLAKGREGFIRSLSNYFPDERQNITRYVEAIYRLTDEVPLFHLLPQGDAFSLHSEEFTMPADAFIARYVDNPKLRAVIAYMNPLYGGRADETPAFIHAIINTLYINGASRFVDGSSHFADSLAKVITHAGGEILTNEGASHVEVNNRHVDWVETTKGNRIVARTYISAIHPCTLLPLCSPKAFTPAFRHRIDHIPNSYSAFSLYVKFRPDSHFPYINHSVYYMSRYDEIWHFGRTDKPWPLGFLFMTPPESHQGPYASKALVTAPMAFDCVKEWEQTQTGHRGEKYEQWKKDMTQLLMNRMEELYPGFANEVEAINSASPLTIRDFYGSKEGCLCGFSKDSHNLALSQLPVVTKIDNLLLTGQNNSLHGFCGVPLTAINTCEALLGRNHIINKIRACVGAEHIL